VEVTIDKVNCSNSIPMNLYSEKGPMGCGEPMGYFFIPNFIIISRLILLNLITVLVIDGYLESRKLETMIFKEAEIELLLKTWAMYDPDRTGMMNCDDFILFLYQMSEPFGTSMHLEPINPKDIAHSFISSKDNTIIISIRTLLEIIKRFPLPVYEVKDHYYVHYVDYISFLTNKTQANYRWWST
jgi:hypothetical protein